MDNAGERLDRAIAARGYESAAAFARRMGVAPGTLRQQINRGSYKADAARRYAARLKVSVEWLLYGKGPDPFADTPDDTPDHAGAAPDHPPAYNGDLAAEIIEIGGEEFFSIGRYDMRISAGTGSIIDPHAEPLAWHPFERQWLTSVTRAMPEMLAILRVDGDSMRPTFDDGDWLLIDRTQRRLNVQGVYAIRIGDTAWVKRLSLNLRDRVVRIISDNPAYPEEQLDEDDLDVLGRVVWIVGRRV